MLEENEEESVVSCDFQELAVHFHEIADQPRRQILQIENKKTNPPASRNGPSCDRYHDVVCIVISW
jgi:hypothetical protein